MGRLSRYLRRLVQYVRYGHPSIKIVADIRLLSPSNLLEGRKVLITGGSKGIGKAIAKRFITQGAEVVITGRNEETLRAVAADLSCHYIVMDVTDTSLHSTILTQAAEKMGGLNVLVNNAGISLHETDLSKVTLEGFDAQFGTNLRAPYFLTQSFINLTQGEKNRDILFITSERGFFCDCIPYGLTKAAINSLIKGLAYRYVKNGIRVNGVAPGVTSSEMTRVALDGNLHYPPNTAGRAYLPEEVAEAALWLVSGLSGCVSGQIICCNQAKTVNPHWK